MIYHIGDKFSLQGTKGQVLYINAGSAWLFPIDVSQEEDSFDGSRLRIGLAFAHIDPKKTAVLRDGSTVKAKAL
jgi:hypothetical protein